MRMNQGAEKSAKDIVNKYSEADLHKILGMYGEIKNARTAAQHAVGQSEQTPRGGVS